MSPEAWAYLWLVDLRSSADALSELDRDERLLQDADCDELATTQAPHHSDRLTARRALRLLIQRSFGRRWQTVPLVRRGRGKPGLTDLEGDFNLSHAGGWALIVLCSRDGAGVDIESDRPVHLRPQRRQAIEHAALAVARGSPLPEADNARTLQAWVRLEACAKADGSGIGALLGAFGIWGGRSRDCASANAGLRSTTTSPPQNLPRVFDVRAPKGCFAAVALPNGIPLPELRRLPDTLAELRALRATANR